MGVGYNGIDQMVITMPALFLPSSVIFSPPAISALVDVPKPHLRSFRGLRVIWAFRSSDHRLIGEPLAGDVINEAVEPIKSMSLHIALVESESELAHVAVKMLFADRVERAVDSAFEEGPNRLNAVGRHAIADVLAERVIDGFVLIVEMPQPVVAAALVSVDGRPRLDAIEDLEFERRLRDVRHCRRLGATAAFAHSKQGSLARATVAARLSLVSVLVGLLAADETLIDFDDAAELGQIPRQEALSEHLGGDAEGRKKDVDTRDEPAQDDFI